MISTVDHMGSPLLLVQVMDHQDKLLLKVHLQPHLERHLCPHRKGIAHLVEEDRHPQGEEGKGLVI